MAVDLLDIERMIARKEPFETIIAALDRCLLQPGAEELRPAVEHTRVSVYCNHGRPPEECARVLDRYLSVESDLVLRADTVWLACSLVPALRPHYLEAQIEALQDAPPDPRVEKRLHELRKLKSTADR